MNLISDKPFCRKAQQDVYGVATGEIVEISCDVFADPSKSVRFEWVFNTSTEIYRKMPENVIGIHSRNGGWTRSYVQHIPKVICTKKLFPNQFNVNGEVKNKYKPLLSFKLPWLLKLISSAYS